MCTSTINLANDGLYKPLQNGARSVEPSQVDGFLLQLLTNRPETKNIESIVDNYFWTIHGDENSIKQIFSKLIQTSSSTRFSKTPQEKAEDLFNAYRETYFSVLKKDQAFQDALEEQKGAFSTFFPASKIENTIQYIVLARIKTMHSIVPGLALEKAFSLPPHSLKLHAFPDHFSPTQTNSPILLTFFQKHFSKFWLHGQTWAYRFPQTAL